MKKFQGKYRIPSARAGWWDYGNNGAYFITICTGGRECCFGMVTDSVMVHSHPGEIVQRYWQEIPQHFPNVRLDVFQVMPNHFHGIIIIDRANETEIIGGFETQRNVDVPRIVETPNLGVSKGTETDTECIEQMPDLDNNYFETPRLDNHKIETPKLDNHIIETPRLDNHIIETPKLGDNIIETPKLGVSTGTGMGTETDTQNKKCGGKNIKWHKGVLGVIINQFKRKCTIECRKTKPDFSWQERFHDHIIRDQEAYDRTSDYIINNPAKWADDIFHPGKPDRHFLK